MNAGEGILADVGDCVVLPVDFRKALCKRSFRRDVVLPPGGGNFATRNTMS